MKKTLISISLFLLFILVPFTVVSAEEGEFMDETIEEYKTTQSSSEKVDSVESYMKNVLYLEKYDYNTNQFSCKWHEIGCHTNSFLFPLAAGFVRFSLGCLLKEESR